MGRMFFQNAVLLDPEAHSPEAGGLLVEDGGIVEKIPATEAGPADCRSIDLEGAHLLPG